MEQVHDDAGVILHDPARFAQPLAAARQNVHLGQPIGQILGQGMHRLHVAAGGDDEVVGDGREMIHLQHSDVHRALFVQNFRNFQSQFSRIHSFSSQYFSISAVRGCT